MISERKFARSYSSFWRLILPLSETYVRNINLRRAIYMPPHQLSVPPERSALVSELGFRFFADLHLRKLASSKETREKISLQTWEYIKSLSGSIIDLPLPSEQDQDDALAIADRIRRFFVIYESGQIVLASPQFSGCGLVDSCEGDILAGSVLYEIKNVERDFRAVDVRQLLTYCALNYAEESYKIDAIGLLNARSGTFFRINIESLCRGMAGAPSGEVLSEIVQFLSTDYSYA
jgi:hypothetical protein